MADKKFTQKVGYDNALDFDPVNGIIKFGSYEMFAKDLGITPQRSELTFDAYREFIKPAFTGAASYAVAPTTAKETEAQRAQFEAAVMDGTFYGQQPRQMGGAADIAAQQKPVLSGRNIQRLGPDTFAVDTYDIPSDQVKGYELLNDISRRAAGIKSGSDDAALKQNQSDAMARRQGRASTVLNTTGA